MTGATMLPQILSYAGLFLFVILLNLVPIFAPPTVFVLMTIYLLQPGFNPLLMALVGCTAATIGRYGLTHLGTRFRRRLLKEETVTKMDKLRVRLQEHRYGGFLTAFVYSLLPVSSNTYFLTIGLMKYHELQAFAGFWLGRFAQYFITLQVTGQIIAYNYWLVVALDAAGIGLTLLVPFLVERHVKL